MRWTIIKSYQYLEGQSFPFDVCLETGIITCSYSAIYSAVNISDTANCMDMAKWCEVGFPAQYTGEHHKEMQI